MATLISGLSHLQHKNVGLSRPIFNKKSKSPLLSKKPKMARSSGRTRMHKAGGISPSVEEFDKMMGSSSTKPKKSMFRMKG